MHYIQAGEKKKLHMFSTSTITTISKQGYDKAFATNYLGHFLLTNRLLPSLSRQPPATTSSTTSLAAASRIITATSGYHRAAIPASLTVQPIAAEGNGNGYYLDAANGISRVVQHRLRAYMNTKLAQLLFAYKLQRRLPTLSPTKSVISVSYCPGWVNTAMLPALPTIEEFVRYFSSSPRASIYTAIKLIFDPTVETLVNQDSSPYQERGFFAANYIIPIIPVWLLTLTDTLRIKPQFMDAVVFTTVIFQAYSYGFHIQETSPESMDGKRGKELYDWSERELKGKGYIV